MAFAQASVSVLTALHGDPEHMLYILAHELRGTLSPIRYAAASLSLQHLPGSPARLAADMIERQLCSSEAIINNVLEAARNRRGFAPISKKRVILNDAVAEFASTVAPLVQDRGQILTCDYSKTPIYVEADIEQLNQILSNLITNATKYSNRGSRIVLQTTTASGKAEIRVRDTGIGMATDELRSVFDLYVQAGHGGSVRAAGGLGIGLYVAKQLAMAHGGTLEATSAGANRGSEFVLALPLAPNVEVAMSGTAAASG